MHFTLVLAKGFRGRKRFYVLWDAHLVSVPFYTIPIFAFKFPKFFIYLLYCVILWVASGSALGSAPIHYFNFLRLCIGSNVAWLSSSMSTNTLLVTMLIISVPMPTCVLTLSTRGLKSSSLLVLF